ncbi:hypothetical protein E1B28_007770 [Marasmius oreades]|uniref:Cytochrome b-c1 complex subunit 8 n=1 Tax=Marasmius oreades TaxID=181124 RepID=A0A9P7UVY8_9AGAR|nr:uncharacterized protein E1B28_007770 [Marasmius oreades]KAG7094159.1 hypothetical protein E1B28_007770 [Marasmius oreades]
MRPSIARLGDMPPPRHAYLKWWGDTHGAGLKQRMTEYTLSPLQSKVAPNMIRNYVFNFYRRVSAEAIYILVPFALGYGIYTWGNKRYNYINSKAGHIAGEHH